MIIGPLLIGLSILLMIMAFKGTHLQALKVLVPSWQSP